MCIAIPAKIIEIKDDMGIVDVEGVKKRASFMLIDNPKIGDYVIVHSGFAMHKVDEYEAAESLKLFRKSMADD